MRQAGAATYAFDIRDRTVTVPWNKSARFDFHALKNTVKQSKQLTFWSMTIRARGQVMEQEGKIILKVTESGEQFLLASGSSRKSALEFEKLQAIVRAPSTSLKANRQVVVTGQVQGLPKPFGDADLKLTVELTDLVNNN